MEALLNEFVQYIDSIEFFKNHSINKRRLLIEQAANKAKGLIKILSRDKKLEYKLADYLIKNRLSFIGIYALRTSENSYIYDLYEYFMKGLARERALLTKEDYIDPSFEKTWLIIDLSLSYYYLSKREDDGIEVINCKQPGQQLHEIVRSFHFEKQEDFQFIIRNLYTQMEKESEEDVVYLLEDILLSGCSQFTTSFTYMIQTEDMTDKELGEQEEDDLDSEEEESASQKERDAEDAEASGEYEEDRYAPEPDFDEDNIDEFSKKQNLILKIMKLLYDRELWEALEILQQYIGGMKAIYKAIGMDQEEFCKLLNEKNTIDSLYFEYKIRKKSLGKEVENKQALIELTRMHRLEFVTLKEKQWILESDNNTRRWMVLYLLIKEQILRCVNNPKEELNAEICSVLRDLPPIAFADLEKAGRPPKMIANLFNLLMEQERYQDVITMIDTLRANNIFRYDETQIKPYFGIYGHTGITIKSRSILRDKLLPAYPGDSKVVVKIFMNTHLKCYVQLPCFLSWYFHYYENIADPMCLTCVKRGLGPDCKKYDRADGIRIKSNNPINDYKIYGRIESINEENRSLTLISSNIRWTRFYFTCFNNESIISRYFASIREGSTVQLLFKRYRYDSKIPELYDLIIVDEELRSRIIEEEQRSYKRMDSVLEQIICSKTLEPYKEELEDIRLWGSEQVYSSGYQEIRINHEEINDKIQETFHVLCQWEPEAVKTYTELIMDNNIWGYHNPNTKDSHKTSIMPVNKFERQGKADLERLIEAGISQQELVHIYMNSYLKASVTLGYFINRITSLDRSKPGKVEISELFQDYVFYGIVKDDNKKFRPKLLIKSVSAYNPRGGLEETPRVIATEELLRSKYGFKLHSWNWNMRNYSIVISDLQVTGDWREE